MLHSLLPKAHHKFLSLPLLGPITDGFDDWLAASGFTRGSRKFSIRMLPLVDAKLRRRHVEQCREPEPPGSPGLLEGSYESLSVWCRNRAHTGAIPRLLRSDR